MLYENPMKLAIPLDFSSTEAARKTLNELKGLPLVMKVGPELILTAGLPIIKEIKDLGFSVFLDLKLHDIPNTVEKSVGRVIDLGVDYCTIHLSGGKPMIESALSLVQKQSSPLKLLGVSVLTSFDQQSWDEVGEAAFGSHRKIEDSVDSLAGFADELGLPGVVCSAFELVAIKKKYPKLFTVVPGIRPKDSDLQDQSRVMTPIEAKNRNADLIVMGRPITKSENPRKSAEKVLEEIST